MVEHEWHTNLLNHYVNFDLYVVWIWWHMYIINLIFFIEYYELWCFSLSVFHVILFLSLLLCSVFSVMSLVFFSLVPVWFCTLPLLLCILTSGHVSNTLSPTLLCFLPFWSSCSTLITFTCSLLVSSPVSISPSPTLYIFSFCSLTIYLWMYPVFCHHLVVLVCFLLPTYLPACLSVWIPACPSCTWTTFFCLVDQTLILSFAVVQLLPLWSNW